MPYRKYSRRNPRRYYEKVRYCLANRPPSQIVQSVILLIAAWLWTWSGFATWNDLTGKPRDAPFLMIPGHARSICFWWAPALFAIYAAITRRFASLAFFFLALGAMVRFGSYMVSWAVSWKWVDRFVPDRALLGDPKAWGSAWIYAAIICGLGGFSYCCRLLRRYEQKIVRLQLEKLNMKRGGDE